MVGLNMFITHEYRFSVLTKSDGCSLEFEPNLLAMFLKVFQNVIFMCTQRCPSYLQK